MGGTGSAGKDIWVHLPPGRRPTWTSSWKLHQHFLKHRLEFFRHQPRFNFGNASEYNESAWQTIETGTRFTYRDRGSRERRVGYYERATRRFVALTEDELLMLTHFPMNEADVLALLESNYSLEL